MRITRLNMSIPGLKAVFGLKVFSGFCLLAVSGCVNSLPADVPPAYFEGTVLDRHAPQVREQMQYLEVATDYEGYLSDPNVIDKVERFMSDYNLQGHGPLIVSVPVSMDGQIQSGRALPTLRHLAWQAGVAWDNEVSIHREAPGSGDSSILMVFRAYTAIASDCPQLGSVDFSQTASNNELPSLGCAVRNNLAMMVADPADLLGNDQLEDVRDIQRRLTQLEAWREGSATAAERSGDEKAQASAGGGG